MKSEESKENFNKTVFLKCPAKLGNKIITFLRSKELINFQYKISQKGSSLYIPINIKKDVKTEIEYKKMGEENGILLLEKILESLNLSVKNEKKLELKSFE